MELLLSLEKKREEQDRQPPNPRSVRISRAQMILAARVGCLRRIESLLDGRPDRNHTQFERTPERLWFNDLNAAMGELAFSLASGRPWDGSHNVGKSVPDFPPDIEVRTRSNHSYELIIREDDFDRRFVLVTGIPPVYNVWGWIWARDAKKRRDWINNPGGGSPCWCVPKNQLNSIDSL